MRLFTDFSLSALAAGFVSVLVGFASTAVIVFQAASALGAGPAETASWMWALGLGMGMTSILPSLYYRQPVVTAWSTPGAAMLITGATGVSLSDATGAFLVSAALVALCGYSGLFERMIGRIPVSLASGMLAGVLLRFGLDVFAAMQTQFALACAMFIVYLLGRKFVPRHAVLVTLVAGLVLSAGQGLLHLDEVCLEMARPVWIAPAFSLAALIGVAIPLFVVTMASQNVPGVAVMRASGYALPVSPVIGFTGTVNLLLAPFGAYALNLAAITAAICMGREAHEDATRRYVAAVSAGVFYLLVGLFGATIGALFAAFPKELVLVIAGLALLGAIGNSLAAALANEREREAALITFLVTGSGISLLGIGPAFWGLMAGLLARLVLRTPDR